MMSGTQGRPAGLQRAHRPAGTSSTDGSSTDEAHGGPADWLIRAIEQHVVPSLLQGHVAPTPPDQHVPNRARPPDTMPTRADVDALVELLLADDVEGAEALVGALLETGMTGSLICEGLLAPAARRLGALWDEDRCDVTAVIQGLWRIQTLVHVSGADDPPAWSGGHPVGRILVAAVPGCTHLLGAVLVAATFRHAGWRVDFEIGVDAGRLCAAVGGAAFDVIALCAGAERDLEQAPGLIAALRLASHKPSVRIMIGGPVLAHHPERALALGADLWATDAAGAVEQANAAVTTPSDDTHPPQ